MINGWKTSDGKISKKHWSAPLISIIFRELLGSSSPSHREIPYRLAVEQAVVYSTLPQEYSTLTFGGEVVAVGGGEEERSEVMYWHRGAYIIYYKGIMGHSCIA